MRDVPPTPRATLRRAREIAKDAGIHHVYTGNVHDREGDTTYCAGCGTALIVRDWYELIAWKLDDGSCPKCGVRCAGVLEPTPGTWGARRLSVKMGRTESRFHSATRAYPAETVSAGGVRAFPRKSRTARMRALSRRSL